MRYFVTGATGFLGNVLSRQLLAQGDKVNIIARNPDKAHGLKELGARVFVGDITDKESMRPAMQGVDAVYHVAGWYKVGAKDKSEGEKVNIQGTRNVLELMQELKIPRGVYTSTCAINSDTKGKLVDESYRFTGKHLSEYDRTKAIAHDIAREFMADGLPLIIVMPGLIYGPGDTSSLRTSIINFLKGRLPALPTQTAVCWAHVEDAARGHLLAMEKGRIGETYIIAGEPHKLFDTFKLAGELTGKRIPLAIPHQMMKILSMLVAPFDTFLPESYTAESLRVVAGVTYLGDNSKARRELGYNPRPLRDGWEATLLHEMKLLERNPS